MSAAFIEPLDVLVLRGNHLFGDPGSFSGAQMPPWPSVFAGALRSHLLVSEGVEPARFATGELEHPVLGTPDRPGPFTLTSIGLGRMDTCNGQVERLFPPPADAVVMEDGEGMPVVHRLVPQALPVSGSFPLPLVPVLRAPQGKPATGWWFTETAWRAWLQGGSIDSKGLVRSCHLWDLDPRPGIGMESSRRAVRDGALFTSEAVVMRSDGKFRCGFVVDVAGLQAPLPAGLLRLGGDGRGARLQPLPEQAPIVPDYATILASRRMRLLLTTPGVFPDGWRLPGTDKGGRFNLHGVCGRLACAAVSRAETVSGWDMARRQPKPAQRVAPTGSIYWIDELEATPEALRKLVESGLWGNPDENSARRAEGFNRCVLAVWP